MPKLYSVSLFGAPLAFAVLIGEDAGSAELEGALQYAPASVGEDAHPQRPL